MLQPNRLYMHKAAMDVAFFVYRKDGKHNTYVGAWYNLGYSGKPWRIDNDTITIKAKHEVNWIDITDSKLIRSKSGVPK